MKIGWASQKGPRDRQEDALAIWQDVVAIADGMGGKAAGDVASRLVVRETIQALKKGYSLTQAVRRANRRLYDEGKGAMGSTLTVARISADRLEIAHVGDCRAYLMRQGKARRLTHDHTVASELARRGALPQAEVHKHPLRHQLTRRLGKKNRVQVDTGGWSLRRGDTVVLATDGVWSVLREEEIAAVSRHGPRTAARRLVTLALKKGAKDNCTAVVASPPPWWQPQTLWEYMLWGVAATSLIAAWAAMLWAAPKIGLMALGGAMVAAIVGLAIREWVRGREKH